MVKRASVVLDSVFSALADPTRRAILARLRKGDATVSLLAEPFPISLPAVSKHLTVLENSGLIEREKQGREHVCRLVAGPLRDAAEWLLVYGEFWKTQLDAFEAHLSQQKEVPHARRPRSQRVALRPQGPRRARGKRRPV
jgi:DNA-binding transcriptional ArsR family regulator